MGKSTISMANLYNYGSHWIRHPASIRGAPVLPVVANPWLSLNAPGQGTPRHRAPLRVRCGRWWFPKKRCGKVCNQDGKSMICPSCFSGSQLLGIFGWNSIPKKRQIHLKNLELCCCLLEWELNTLLSNKWIRLTGQDLRLANICCVFQSCLSPTV